MLFTRREILASTLAVAILPIGVTSAKSADLGGTALIFVGASWCPVCKQAAPVLALFAERRGLPVLVASADARPIAPFPSFVPVAGHPIAEAIDRFPTTLVFSSTTQGLVGAFEGYRDPAHYTSRLNVLLEQAGALT